MRRLVNELGMILVALSLSVVVWIVAMQEENPIQDGDFSRAIPVEVRNRPEGTTLFPRLSQDVTVTIRAPSTSWKNLRADMFAAWVDLAGQEPGDYEMEIQVSCKDSNVVILEFVPVTVPVSLRKEISREVPVHVRLAGSVAAFYELKEDQISVEPETVVVTGPEEIVEQVLDATVFFTLDDSVKETIVAKRPVVARQANGESVGSFVSIEPSSVDVLMPIEQRTGFKEVAVRPMVSGVPASGYRLRGVSVVPATVTLGGDTDAVAAIVGYVENIPLDITGATEDVVERLPLNLPEGATAVGVQGVLVTANIEPLPGRQTLSRVPIVQGLSTGLVAQVTPERVSLTLTGPLPRLNAISQEDVQVYVELVGKGVGQHNIALTYLVPEGLALESIVPAVVDVVITQVTPTPVPTPTATRTSTPTPTPTPILTGTLAIRTTGTVMATSASGTRPAATPTQTSSPTTAVVLTVTLTPTKGN